MDSDNTDFDASPNEQGTSDQLLTPMEALDSDDVRNNDGDEVVDPPEGWSPAVRTDYGKGTTGDAGESLDDKLAAEVPDSTVEGGPAMGDQEAGDTEELADDQIDHLAPDAHGREKGQISGAPEDGESFFPVVE
jgi:hypothetical protein